MAVLLLLLLLPNLAAARNGGGALISLRGANACPSNFGGNIQNERGIDPKFLFVRTMAELIINTPRGFGSVKSYLLKDCCKIAVRLQYHIKN